MNTRNSIPHGRFCRPPIEPLRNDGAASVLISLRPFILEKTSKAFLDQRAFTGDRNDRAYNQEEENEDATT
jgi:hypothetical protein